jgi:hypothetical protein
MWIRRWLVASIAVLGLALGAAQSSASRSVSFEPSGGIELSGRLSIGLPEEVIVACNITMRLTVSSRVPKIMGIIAGHITAMAIDHNGQTQFGGGCRSYRPTTTTTITALSLGEALWQFTYQSFLGSLPAIAGIEFVLEDFLFSFTRTAREIAPLTCLYKARAVRLLAAIEAGVLQTMAWPNTEMILVRGLECPLLPRLLASTFTVSPTVRATLL